MTSKPKGPVSLSFWIALLDIPPQDETKALAAAHAASRTLETYLNKAGAKARFGGINPSAASVQDGDLLLHVCVGSLIEGIAKNLNISTKRETGTGIATGATADMDGSGVLSEVYWPVVLGRGEANDAGRGKVLANIAFHEFVHNKSSGTDTDVHSNGGDGVLRRQVNTAILRGAPNDANYKLLRTVIGRRVKQYPYCLFNDLLGY